MISGMDVSAISPAELDFACIMKRFERAYIRIFALDLADEIAQAEAFKVRERTLDALYSGLQFSDFARGYAALAEVSNYPQLKDYRRIRGGNLAAGLATAQLKDVDSELTEFGPLPFALAVERRLGQKAAQINGNDFDRMLWRLYRVFCEPWRVESTPRRSRQLLLILGLNELPKAFCSIEQARWLDAGWPQLTAAAARALLNTPASDVFAKGAWAQL